MSLVSDPRPLNAADVKALNQAALRALSAGDACGAKEMLQQAVAADPDATALRLNLAAAHRALGELDAAMEAIQTVLIAEPRHFMALLMKAAVIERLGDLRQAGAAYGVALVQAPPPEHLDAATLKAVARARELHAAYNADLARAMTEAVAGARAGGGGGESRRVNAFIDRLTGRRRVYQQQPMQFNYPGLPAIEFYDRELFPWLDDMEAATAPIRGEFLAAFTEGAPEHFQPYVEYPDGMPLDQWAELNNSPRWSAFHLFKEGARVQPNCRRCPATIEALSAVSQPEAPGRSPAAMFSLLQPRTRIPAHTGVSNTRLVVHLPLVLPPGCGFRVGSETREWRMGEAWVFDDTIEHEAWNDSDQPRAILIFDVWSPFLSHSERAMVVQVMNALDRFHGVTRVSAFDL
jgi:aspartyl/asparaginyl beta-hydroxylase (cupin superfamily)